MNKLISQMATTIALCCASQIVLADFNFCSSTNAGGSDGFQQNISKSQTVTIGELPSEIEGINIQLRATSDLDVQLYDKQTGIKIVGWPDGTLNGSSRATTNYQGMSITWSGYNGDGSGLGNEYIIISGQTTRPLIMKAFGYDAGNAVVNYSWKKGSSGCQIPTQGGDVFQQNILYKDVVKVGDIPPGVENLYVKLSSNRDLDIQLYDKDTNFPIVQYPDGTLKGAGLQTTNYYNMQIEWSGYNGNGSGSGNEYIKITGLTTRNLTLKAFGFQSGSALVEYSWGSSSQGNEEPLNLRPGDDGESVRLSGSTLSASICTFRDINQNEWYAKYVNALCSSGIVVGYYTTSGPEYKPSQYATIAEALKVANYASDYDKVAQQCQDTKNASNWYQCHLDIAKSHGALSWQDSSAATTQIKRGDMFVYTTKVFFGISASPTNAVEILKSKGVLNAEGSATYDPRIYDNLTRVELAIVAVRAARAANKKLPYGLVPQPYPQMPLEQTTDLPASTTPAPIPNPYTSDFGQKIINKARKELGKTGYPWTDGKYTYCARFVRMMFDKPSKGHAYQMCDSFASKGLIQKSGTAPVGSVVCYPKNSPGSGGYGHIAIATGTGTEIGVTSLSKGVTERKIQSNNIGWIYPEKFRDNY